jgi:hypothetical protein
MAKKKYIQLPKGYLSYSQIQLWKSDKKRYIELYFNNRNELRLSNSGLEYGKIVADALEKGVATDDLLTDTAMSLITQYDVRDKEIVTEIKTKYGSVGVMGRPDTMDSVTKAFREFKTGRVKWTEGKAQKHPQMIFYAMLIYLKFGVMLSEAYLDWIETEEVDHVVKPTGRVETFRVTFTPQQIMECMAMTSRVAKEIEIAWASHIMPPEEVF